MVVEQELREHHELLAEVLVREVDRRVHDALAVHADRRRHVADADGVQVLALVRAA